MDARKTRRLRVPDEWDAISPDVKGGSWDSERQFTPAEFRSLLEAAGFASIEHRGYGLLTGLLVSAHLRRKLASFMQDLCRAEAAASGMADISACEMQFVRGRKPGQFVR